MRKHIEDFVNNYRVDIIQSDQGKEFLNKEVQNILKDKNIKHY